MRRGFTVTDAVGPVAIFDYSPPGSRGDAPVMDAPQVCAYLKITRATLYRLIKPSEIPYFRIAYHCRFNREQIDEWRLDRG